MSDLIILLDALIASFLPFLNTQMHLLLTNTFRQNFVLLTPYMLSAVSIYIVHLQGQMRRSAWIIGLAAQCGWLSWSTVSGTYGFLPLNLVLFYQYWDNYRKWSIKQTQ